MATLRRDVASLSTLAAADLRGLWSSVDTPDAARDALRDLLPNLVTAYGTAAATVAADWYDDLRDERDVRGSFRAIPFEVTDMGAASLAGFGVGPLYQATPDWAAAKVLIEGGLQRRIANASRLTVTDSSVADPQARGWSRVGSGECAFCAMLIGQGQIYSEATADFASHDHCNCAAVPAFEGEPRPVKPYTPTSRNITDADRARVREYLRTH